MAKQPTPTKPDKTAAKAKPVAEAEKASAVEPPVVPDEEVQAEVKVETKVETKADPAAEASPPPSEEPYHVDAEGSVVALDPADIFAFNPDTGIVVTRAGRKLYQVQP